jgi:NAD(P)-dependent dehydrogenase (short-subunit alcohol dehydrogenase family)
LRDALPSIRAAGAELVVVGSGSAAFASAFRDDERLDCPVLVDPELRTFRAAGFRRGHVEVVSVRMLAHAARALWAGHRQRDVQGDVFQLGGVLVIGSGGALRYRYASHEAGDHPPVAAVLDALRQDAPPLAEPGRAPWWQRVGARALGLAVDPTIALSFARPGYLIHALGNDARDLDVDLTGRRCVVTGANSGIGFEAARALAELGATVILACRDAARGEGAARRIRDEVSGARVVVETIDMSDLGAVAAGAERIAAGGAVDALVHNAGLLPAERIETADGLELTFATHVAGPFLLTARLRDALERAPDARVVWVSSGGMYTRRLALDDPQWTARPYDGVLAYAETKRAQVVLAELWAEAFRGTRVTVSAMHPGWVDTPGVRSSLPRFHRVTRAVLRTPAEGADTIVWLAASPAARAAAGRLYLDRRPWPTHLVPFTHESAADRRALWEMCERVAVLPPWRR